MPGCVGGHFHVGCIAARRHFQAPPDCTWSLKGDLDIVDLGGPEPQQSKVVGSTIADGNELRLRIAAMTSFSAGRHGRRRPARVIDDVWLVSPGTGGGVPGQVRTGFGTYQPAETNSASPSATG